MRTLVLAAGALALGWASGVAAQSIEESYANLCSDQTAAQNETCTALREALMAKLAEQSGAAKPKPAKSVKKAAAKKTAAKKPGKQAVAKSWGFYATLPDAAAYHAPGSIMIYSWKEKDSVIEAQELISGARSTITLRDDGTLETASDKGRWTMAVQPDGSFLQADPAGKWRNRIALVDGGIRTAIELPKDGAWSAYSETLSKPLTPQQLADARAAMQQAGQPENIRANWGLYAQLAGSTWVHKLYETRYIWSYDWVIPGVSLASQFAATTDKKVSSAPTPKAVTAFWDPVTKNLFVPSEERQPDGSFVMNMGNMRTTARSTGPDSFEKLTEELKKGKWKKFHRERFQRSGGPDIQATLASLTATQPKSGGGGGLFGSLVGAAVGAYASAAAGLDTGETVGAVMKGMSITNPDSPMAAALGSTGDQLLTGGGATSALASGVGGAASGGGSYPTKPNLATGACSGFTEGNYRTKALEGGGDSQLNTMCGQAFEYYTMYKRAIAQGYSEADANRTYAAHEQSARVANGYLSSHGAN